MYAHHHHLHIGQRGNGKKIKTITPTSQQKIDKGLSLVPVMALPWFKTPRGSSWSRPSWANGSYPRPSNPGAHIVSIAFNAENSEHEYPDKHQAELFLATRLVVVVFLILRPRVGRSGDRVWLLQPSHNRAIYLEPFPSLPLSCAPNDGELRAPWNRGTRPTPVEMQITPHPTLSAGFYTSCRPVRRVASEMWNCRLTCGSLVGLHDGGGLGNFLFAGDAKGYFDSIATSECGTARPGSTYELMILICTFLLPPAVRSNMTADHFADLRHLAASRDSWASLELTTSHVIVLRLATWHGIFSSRNSHESKQLSSDLRSDGMTSVAGRLVKAGKRVSKQPRACSAQLARLCCTQYSPQQRCTGTSLLHEKTERKEVIFSIPAAAIPDAGRRALYPDVLFRPLVCCILLAFTCASHRDNGMKLYDRRVADIGLALSVHVHTGLVASQGASFLCFASLGHRILGRASGAAAVCRGSIGPPVEWCGEAARKHKVTVSPRSHASIFDLSRPGIAWDTAPVGKFFGISSSTSLKYSPSCASKDWTAEDSPASHRTVAILGAPMRRGLGVISRHCWDDPRCIHIAMDAAPMWSIAAPIFVSMSRHSVCLFLVRSSMKAKSDSPHPACFALTKLYDIEQQAQANERARSFSPFQPAQRIAIFLVFCYDLAQAATKANKGSLSPWPRWEIPRGLRLAHGLGSQPPTIRALRGTSWKTGPLPADQGSGNE
ncbi:hypothetical protein ACRALDRAFT_205595 [Sodiomyces alcalophilus JCM 7366]|uniref:uncharacterized protein n=1 Tax=Sodiomyces alcalophilus JCM 7366 TaxID=591952 RepID=UPI0039B6B6E3